MFTSRIPLAYFDRALNTPNNHWLNLDVILAIVFLVVHAWNNQCLVLGLRNIEEITVV